jgi:hypothetical protein
VFYASPSGADDADCLTRESAGSLSSAWKKLSSASGNKLIVLNGTYDLSKVDPSINYNQGTMHGVGYLGLNKSLKGEYSIEGESGGEVVFLTSSTEGNRKAISACVSSLSVANINFEGFDASKTMYASQAYGYGAVINSRSYSLCVSNCVFKSNKTEWNGVIYSQNTVKSFSLIDCKFISNNVNKGEGLIKAYGECLISGCVFDSNYIPGGNGNYVIGSVPGNTVISNCIFKAHRSGAGQYIQRPLFSTAVVNFIGCKFNGIMSKLMSTYDGILNVANGSSFVDCIFENCGQFASSGNYLVPLVLSKSYNFDRCVFKECNYIFQGSASVIKNTLFEDCLLKNENGLARSLIYNSPNIEIFNSNFIGTKGTGYIIDNQKTLKNSLFYNNETTTEFKGTAGSVYNNFYQNTKSTELPPAVNNNYQIQDGDNIGFKLEREHPYQITGKSILRRKGAVLDGQENEKDLAGNVRLVLSGTTYAVDVGAYQYIPPIGFKISLR